MFQNKHLSVATGIAAITFAIMLPAHGDQTFYIGPNNGLWSNGSNWDSGVQPAIGSDVIVGQFIPNRAGDVSVTFDGNYPDFNHALNSLRLDATGTTGAIIINQSSNSSAAYALTEYIGTAAGRSAAYNQTAGRNYVGSLYLGFDAGSTGNYHISVNATIGGSTIGGANDIIVGNFGAGTVLQDGGSVNTTSLFLARQPGSSANYTLTGGTLNVGPANFPPPAEIVGYGASASFVQSGGIHIVGFTGITNGVLGIGDGSVYSLSGGLLTLLGGDEVGGGGKLINEGNFNVSGGTLTITGRTNPTGASISNLGPPDGNGTFNYTGGSISFPNGGTIENTGTFNIHVPVATLPVVVTNSALFNVTASTISFGNTFTNNGNYSSTVPSTQNFVTLNIGENGYLQGGAGDVFSVGRNLTNNSAKIANFDLSRCWLVLSGGGVSHRLAWPGADMGTVVAGYANNFAVGVLKLKSGNSLVLLDGNAASGGAIYTEVFQLDDGVAQIANISSSGGISIYYDPNNAANAYLGGNTYQLNGGGVVAPVSARTPPPDPTPSPTPATTPTPTPGLVANVSTRLPVGQDPNALFQGFIVQGPAGSTKKILVRALGPFLQGFGITDFLANPTLDIFDGNQVKVASNDDWKTTQVGGLITGDQFAELNASGLAPTKDLESAIIANLAPGQYTAVVRGSGNSVGTGLVDAFDISAASPARLVNVGTRGLVQPGDGLLTAGFIVQNGSVRVVIRAVGPSLTAFGITNALPDTTLQLRDVNGAIVRENDDWMTDQKQELLDTGLQPSNSLEAALVATIPPGQYTAQVRGKPEGTGIGVVEVYFLQ